ncbi:MAG: hypothetical protein M4579_005038 [Chaenotheca gracillima]|nr:MAG: hypothetical protein M4579_005038 [Chaenotheca gracillima]
MSDTVPQAKVHGVAGTLPPGGLIALGWAGVIVSAFFVAGRTWLRVTRVDRLHVSDYLVFAAFGVLVVNAILNSLLTDPLYYMMRAGAGLVPADERLMLEGNRYVRFEFASIGLFWTILWLVKFSYLFLFRRLHKGLPSYQKIWTAIGIFMVGAYIGCWVASIMDCHPPSAYFHFGSCTKPIDVRGSTISIWYSTAVDILSDILIMILPLRSIWGLRMARKEKIGLAVVFCLGAIIIVVALVRAIEIYNIASQDPVSLAVWSIVESTVSVIVGCLPPFKTLFVKQRSTYPAYGSDVGGSKRPTYRLESRCSVDDTPRSMESQEQIVPDPNAVKVHTVFTIEYDDHK